MAVSACKTVDRVNSLRRSAASTVAVELPSTDLTNSLKHAHPYQHKVLTAFHTLKQPFTRAKLLKCELMQTHWSTCLQILEGHNMLRRGFQSDRCILLCNAVHNQLQAFETATAAIRLPGQPFHCQGIYISSQSLHSMLEP